MCLAHLNALDFNITIVTGDVCKLRSYILVHLLSSSFSGPKRISIALFTHICHLYPSLRVTGHFLRYTKQINVVYAWNVNGVTTAFLYLFRF